MNSNLFFKTVKKTSTLLCAVTLFLSTLAFGQVPDAINYQAAVRSNSGNVMANHSVDFRFTVYSGPTANTSVYEESHTTTTNLYGLVNLQIGSGTVISGSFANINWGANLHHLKVEVDTGNGFSDMGTTQLVAVPYALSAKKVTGMKLSDIDDISKVTPTASQIIKYDGVSWVFDSVQDSDSQTLSLIGQNLSISNGNMVSLPPAQMYYAGPGLTSVNDTFFANASSPIWNAVQLNGNPISPLAPTDSSLLQWNSTNNAWEPVSFNEGLWYQNDSNDIYHRMANVGVGVSYPTSKLHIKGDSDAVRIEGTLNPNGHGGRLSFGADDSVYISEHLDDELRLRSNNIFFDSDTLFTRYQNGAPATQIYNNLQPLGSVLSMNGPSGTRHLSMGSNGNAGYFNAVDNKGNIKLQLGVLSGFFSGSTGYVNLMGDNGGTNVRLGSNLFQDNLGKISLDDTSSQSKINLFVHSSHSGIIETMGPNGFQNVALTSLASNPDHGYINISDSQGNGRVSALVLTSGEGYLQTSGVNGNSNIRLTTLANNPNNPYLSIDNVTGATEAGIYVNTQGQGIVFGDVKNFRMPHPEQAGKEIWYASLEGAEAAAYQRGTATLANGEVKVTFPEHYNIVANTSTMTVVLTPLDASSKGMAVVEKTENGFTVKELANGTGSYSFDWEVKCVRKGYEEYKVIRDGEDCKASGSSELLKDISQKNPD